MGDQIINKKNHHILYSFFKDYEWIHVCLGLLGNLTFFIGSIFFLWESLKTAGVWLFIIGSFLMLIGSIGGGLTKYIARFNDFKE